VNGVNLIPPARILARKRTTRLRRWASVVPAFASVLLAIYAGLRTTWHTDTATVQATLVQFDAANRSIEQQIAKARAEAAKQQITLKAHRAVGEQPNWGVLLYIIAGRLGENTVLNNCSLEPMLEPGKPDQGARPARFRVTLTGMGRDQEAVSAFVLALEREADPRLFDHVRLLESRRAPFAGKDAVIYRIECLLSDAAAEVK
jgi:hypothetical protein